MISSKFALNIISRSLKNISTLDLYFKSSKFPYIDSFQEVT